MKFREAAGFLLLKYALLHVIIQFPLHGAFGNATFRVLQRLLP